MLGLDREVAAVTGPPTAERVQALKRILPGATIRAIPKRTGQTQPCRRLPTWFMVWFVIGLGLFATDCYRQVFRWLQRCRRRRTPARTTRCEARRRLGVAPVRALMDRIVRLLATPRTPGACYCGLRLMALDGFVVDLPDTAANGRAFGRPHNGRAPAAFPPARVPARCAVGTHVLWKCPVKPKHRAEIRLAAALPRFLAPDRLLLWGRGFCSDDNVRDVAARRAHVPARAQSTRVRAKVRALADGSDLARLYPSAKHRRKDRDGPLVRAIDYTVGDRGRPGAGPAADPAVPRALGGGTGDRRVEDPPAATPGAAQPDARGGGPGALRAAAGAFRGAAADGRGGGGPPAAAAALVLHGRLEDLALPLAGVPAGRPRAAALVSGLAGGDGRGDRGAAARAGQPARHPAQAQQMAQEAAGASALPPANPEVR